MNIKQQSYNYGIAKLSFLLVVLGVGWYATGYWWYFILRNSLLGYLFR